MSIFPSRDSSGFPSRASRVTINFAGVVYPRTGSGEWVRASCSTACAGITLLCWMWGGQRGMGPFSLSGVRLGPRVADPLFAIE